ncbi:Ig-like domain-containing protein [Nocardioides sambongensis]|uniref:Ig-like domain-containing protein n=1 Tax=Nocardioides sambongensis TaxID=2589074 RepID=UPI00112BF945|nr:Ig-like domain-containing protein [Nocardioides sambongensis]
MTPVDVTTSATRATGHNDFRADGVRVWTEGSTSTDKAAGYFDVHLPLAAVGEPAMEWSSSQSAQPGLQLATDFDGDGDIDGVLVGEAVYGGNWWVGSIDDQAVFAAPNTPPTTGGGGSQFNGTLDEWRAAYPDAQVLQAGWSLGSGVKGDGVIYSLTVGATDYLFSRSEGRTTTLYPNEVVHTDTRATGHNDFRQTSGVRVWTEGSTSTDKATGYFTVGEDLARVGEPSMQWRANGTDNRLMPGLQLVIDVDGDGEPDGLLVGERTYADGTRLYQENFGLTNWWLTGSSTDAVKAMAPSDKGGYGSAFNGTLAEWRAALPGATVISAGWSLGSGVKGDGVIEAITVGSTTYTFTGSNRAPQSADAELTVASGASGRVRLQATDADGDTLTYSVDGRELTGATFRYQAPPDFAGQQTVEYQVTDGRDIATGEIAIDVVPARTKASMVVGPQKLTSKKVVRVRLHVTSTGSTSGGRVQVAVDGKRAGRGVIGDNGRVKVVLAKKLAKGKHWITATYRGTDYTAGVVRTTRVRVR